MLRMKQYITDGVGLRIHNCIIIRITIHIIRQIHEATLYPQTIYIYIYINLVGPGNSLGVSVALPSFTFPSGFRQVSVTFPSTFPPRFRNVSLAFPLRFRSRFRCASLGTLLPPSNSPSTVVLRSAGGRADPKTKLFWHSGSDLIS